MGALEGRVAVVTGSGRGIGRGIALLFAREGAKVVVNDPGGNIDGSGHDNGPADQVVAEIKAEGGTAVACYDSVATVDGGEAIIKTAIDSFERLDILVNNAGILRDRMIFNMSEQEWDDVIAVHLKGHYNCTRPASILMRQQRFGRIINFSSGSGIIGNPGQANYGAAKSGVAGFTRVVAKDLGRYGVTCNAIAPGAATRMIGTISDQSRELRQRAGIGGPGGQPPQQRPVAPTLRDPEMVAPMVAYLASDDAWNINGQIFHVAGGTVGIAHQPTPMRTLWKPAMWTLDELEQLVPTQLMAGVPNPAPPPPDLDIPGRPAKQPEGAPAGGAA
ncbi:MAG TPA: SDR family NAD(P)-dependent oxidoreductase [Dehalococcoidia bacterium]|nr:SDR family NAD(P)-dependent oxidoreductase [Dehalococcoidia bacterium]